MPTVAQLKKHNLYNQIKGRSKMNKAQLINALRALGGVILQDVKKSRKRKSIKRRNVSRKKRSRKRRKKVSSKVKKCPPGCVKKQSRKRKSVKRKVSRKRKSVKRKVSRKRKSVKRKVSRKRRSAKIRISNKRKLKNIELSSLISGKGIDELIKFVSKIKTTKKKATLKCTQDSEMIYQMQTIDEVPKELLIKFRLSPSIVHGYNLLLLRNWLQSGQEGDPMTSIKFTKDQLDEVKSRWAKLRKNKKSKILKLLVEEEIIPTTKSTIPNWSGKIETPPYELVISQATPYLFFIAIHIVDVNKRKKEFANDMKILTDGWHNDKNIWKRVEKISHWTIILPSPGDSAVSMSGDPLNPTVWYDEKNQKRLLASNQDSATVVGDLIKAWETKKVLTKKVISKTFKRTNIEGDSWSLNLPLIAQKMTELQALGLVFFNKDVLQKGGTLISLFDWIDLRGGRPNQIRHPGHRFYELWAIITEQIESLIYNETPQY